MKIHLHGYKRSGTSRPGFTLVEAIVAMAVVGIVVMALYGGITSSFLIIRIARENLRATQIMLEKMEVMRLCTWDQVNSNGFIPSTFTASYYTKNSTNLTGVIYDGRITIAPVTALQINGSYNDDMRKITVDVGWTTQNQNHTRQISTYVSRYGIQNYLFN